MYIMHVLRMKKVEESQLHFLYQSYCSWHKRFHSFNRPMALKFEKKYHEIYLHPLYLLHVSTK